MSKNNIKTGNSDEDEESDSEDEPTVNVDLVSLKIDEHKTDASMKY